MDVRPVEPGDCQIICDIYNYYIENTVISFEEQPLTVDEMAQRVLACTVSYPWLVCVDSGRVVGYAYAGAYRPRLGYRYTVENSVYIHPHYQQRGLGRRLLAQLIATCEAGGYRQMVAVIGDSGNIASIRLHQALGFVHVGTLPNVGFKHGRWLDCVLMQRSLGDGDRRLPDGDQEGENE